MTSEQVRSLGVKEVHSVTSPTEIHAEELSIDGFTILTEVVSDSELTAARTQIDRAYDAQAAEVGGHDKLQAIGDTGIARCLLAYDDNFLAMAVCRPVLAVVERLLGDYFTLSQQNAVINMPGDDGAQGAWHRDLLYQHFVSSRPLAVSALFCIDDFSRQSGGTLVLRGSHRVEGFPSEQFVLGHELAIEAPAGSVLMFDSMLYHRGGANSSSLRRRAVNHLFTLPFIKQQIDIPRVLDGRHSSDPFLRRLLGYESQPAGNVLDWRNKRLEGRS